MTELFHHDLKELAVQVGLTVITATSAEDLELEAARLEAWQAGGMAGDMGYMERPAELLTSPRRLLASAKSVVTVAVFYERAPRYRLEPGYGRIARYAWGRDYHKVLRQRLTQLLELVQARLGRVIDARIFSDSVPLLERALASRAGLGFIGKNTMAIMPGQGSFFFLGEILWDVELDLARPTVASRAHCGGCTQCISGCPTGAIVKERTLDARRCISYLTIEKRGVLSYLEREWIGEWLFGCDICQEVCPFNAAPMKRGEDLHLDEFSRSRGIGPALSLEMVLRIKSDAEFYKIFGGTPLTRTKRIGLARNAAVVAANTHAADLFPVLTDVAHADPSPMVRAHALWASAVIANKEGEDRVQKVRSALDRLCADDDPILKEECANIRTQLRNFA